MVVNYGLVDFVGLGFAVHEEVHGPAVLGEYPGIGAVGTGRA